MTDLDSKKIAQTDSESSTNMPSISVSIRNNSLILGLFALACTAIIAATFEGTEDNINLQKREARLKALLEVIPKHRHNNDMLHDKIVFSEPTLGHRQAQTVFLAKQNNENIALIYSATARGGYSGDIDYIIGINIDDESIAGVRVLKHKETPGLGDRIELRKSNWILDFNGHSLSKLKTEAWTVKKEGGAFDAFTGATITPRALTQSIASVLKYHHQQKKALLLKFDAPDKSKTNSTTVNQP